MKLSVLERVEQQEAWIALLRRACATFATTNTNPFIIRIQAWTRSVAARACWKGKLKAVEVLNRTAKHVIARQRVARLHEGATAVQRLWNWYSLRKPLKRLVTKVTVVQRFRRRLQVRCILRAFGIKIWRAYQKYCVSKNKRIKSLWCQLQIAKKNCLVCPISHCGIKEPAICVVDGQIYEKSCIREWVGNAKTSPMTRDTVKLDDIVDPKKIGDFISKTRTDATSAIIRSLFGDVIGNWSGFHIRIDDGKLIWEELGGKGTLTPATCGGWLFKSTLNGYGNSIGDIRIKIEDGVLIMERYGVRNGPSDNHYRNRRRQDWYLDAGHPRRKAKKATFSSEVSRPARASIYTFGVSNVSLF